jgi:small subunit ribosomal protein S8
MVKNNLSLAFSIIKTGSISFKSHVHVPTTKLNLQMLSLLYKEGFIRGFYYNEKRAKVFLKFNNYLKPALRSIKIISTPGKKVIVSHKTLCQIKKNSGFFIINSNKGLITLEEALFKYKVGGEILCKII